MIFKSYNSLIFGKFLKTCKHFLCRYFHVPSFYSDKGFYIQRMWTSRSIVSAEEGILKCSVFVSFDQNERKFTDFSINYGIFCRMLLLCMHFQLLFSSELKQRIKLVSDGHTRPTRRQPTCMFVCACVCLWVHIMFVCCRCMCFLSANLQHICTWLCQPKYEIKKNYFSSIKNEIYLWKEIICSNFLK